MLAVTIISCSDTKSERSNALDDATWHLRSVTCECEPPQIDKDQYTFEFDLESNTVTVTNETNVNSNLLLESGTYDILQEEEKLTINGILYYYNITEEQLTLDENGQSVVDAPFYVFDKD